MVCIPCPVWEWDGHRTSVFVFLLPRATAGTQTHKFCVHFTNRFGPEYKAELAQSCDCVINSGWMQKHKIGLKPTKTVSFTRLNTILCSLVSIFVVITIIDFCNQWICVSIFLSEWCVFFVSRGLCPNLCFVSTYDYWVRRIGHNNFV